MPWRVALPVGKRVGSPVGSCRAASGSRRDRVESGSVGQRRGVSGRVGQRRVCRVASGSVACVGSRRGRRSDRVGLCRAVSGSRRGRVEVASRSRRGRRSDRVGQRRAVSGLRRVASGRVGSPVGSCRGRVEVAGRIVSGSVGLCRGCVGSRRVASGRRSDRVGLRQGRVEVASRSPVGSCRAASGSRRGRVESGSVGSRRVASGRVGLCRVAGRDRAASRRVAPWRAALPVGEAAGAWDHLDGTRPRSVDRRSRHESRGPLRGVCGWPGSTCGPAPG